MPALKRITYVEDEPDVRAVVNLALEKVGGFAVDPCCSGVQALERAPGFGPDLILLDVMMPGMDGEETFLKLRDMPVLASVPIAFMTANSQTREIERYLALGADGVVPKPFDVITLPERLHVIWRYFHQL